MRQHMKLGTADEKQARAMRKKEQLETALVTLADLELQHARDLTAAAEQREARRESNRTKRAEWRAKRKQAA